MARAHDLNHGQSTQEDELLLDPHLISKKNSATKYTCGRGRYGCGRLAIHTKVLACDAKYHNNEHEPIYFCGQCAKTIIAANHCAIDQHENPYFEDANGVNREIQHIYFLCPYSKQFEERKQNENVRVDDTLHNAEEGAMIDDEKRDKSRPHYQVHNELQSFSSHFCSHTTLRYSQLQKHIKEECEYRPIPCEFDECKNNKNANPICPATKARHLQQHNVYHLQLLNENMKTMRVLQTEYVNEKMDALRQQMIQIQDDKERAMRISQTQCVDQKIDELRYQMIQALNKNIDEKTDELRQQVIDIQLSVTAEMRNTFNQQFLILVGVLSIVFCLVVFTR